MTSTVSLYISFCVDSSIPCKEITIFPNNKLWVTKELKSIINIKKHIIYTGSIQEKEEINRVLRSEIRKAKGVCRDKLEHKYTSRDLRATWKGIKSTASISQGSSESDRNIVKIEGINMTDLPNAFNSFYSRFEVHDFSENISLLRDSVTPYSNNIIEQEHVRNLLKDIRKAPGPDLYVGIHFDIAPTNSVVSSISFKCHLSATNFLACGNPPL